MQPGKLSAYSSQFRLFIMICILWATRLEITIHSNERNPFAFQLLYYGVTFAPTLLISLLLKLSGSVRCYHISVWDIKGVVTSTDMPPLAVLNPDDASVCCFHTQQCCCRRSSQQLCWELYLLQLRIIVKFRTKKKVLQRLLDSEKKLY